MAVSSRSSQLGMIDPQEQSDLYLEATLKRLIADSEVQICKMDKVEERTKRNLEKMNALLNKFSEEAPKRKVNILSIPKDHNIFRLQKTELLKISCLIALAVISSVVAGIVLGYLGVCIALGVSLVTSFCMLLNRAICVQNRLLDEGSSR